MTTKKKIAEEINNKSNLNNVYLLHFNETETYYLIDENNLTDNYSEFEFYDLRDSYLYFRNNTLQLELSFYNGYYFDYETIDEVEVAIIVLNSFEINPF